ncbi:MAG TPA: glycosyltransferase family A protein, partial [Vicinamibacterales bacterium]|nr:glycosyltransferase family A protein [Vicinamibacterales bacterium]
MTARRRVSIVIPTLNAGPLLGRLLDAVDGQEGDYDRELIAIDSGSTDGTLDRLRDRGVIIRHVPPGGFNHGEARNAALDVASADVAILLVQDAVPAAPGWLQALVRPLDADERVAGSFARQQPWPDASRLTAYYLDQWVAARAEPRTVGPLSRSRLDAMLPADRHLSCAFDNVCSCIRMSAWRKYRFRRTPIAEDLLWAREVLTAGYRLAYVPEAVVWHSHERPVA